MRTLHLDLSIRTENATLARHSARSVSKTLLPQMKEASQTFEVEWLWHLATPRSPAPHLLMVRTGWEQLSRPAFVGWLDEGPCIPLCVLPPGYTKGASHNDHHDGERAICIALKSH